jgi:hypothetical protein
MVGAFKAQGKKNAPKEHHRIEEIDGMCTYDEIIDGVVEVVDVESKSGEEGQPWSGLIWC